MTSVFFMWELSFMALADSRPAATACHLLAYCFLYRVEGAPELGLALNLTGACCATSAQPDAVTFRWASLAATSYLPGILLEPA